MKKKDASVNIIGLEQIMRNQFDLIEKVCKLYNDKDYEVTVTSDIS